MNVEHEWDWEVDYVPVEGLWEKVTEKEVLEALKRMKKGNLLVLARCHVRYFQLRCV